MNLTQLTLAQLQKIVALVKRRQKLSAEITRIEKCIQKLDGSGKVNRPLRKAGRSTKKSPIKDEILRALEAAGKKGLRIRDLASTVKRTPTHLSVWLATAGKKVKGLKRVGYGVYAYVPAGK